MATARGHGKVEGPTLPMTSSTGKRGATSHTVERGRAEDEMNRIVVGIDGSEASQRALHWAVEEARAHGATVAAVHGWLGPAAAMYSLGAIPIDPDLFREAAREVLDKAIASIDDADLVKPLEAKLVEGGASHVILEEALDADLVVVGSRGRGGFAGLLLGSVSQQVVHHATCPVLVIPAPPH